MARQVAQGLGALWGQTVIVENRPGAGGNIGLEHVGRAKPDGYTLLFTPSAPLVTNKLFSKELKVDPDKFAAIAQVSRSTVMMIASNKIAAKTVPELIAYAKANPGKLNFASTGAGSSTHLTSELFMQLAAIKGEIIPYQGISPANIAMMSGDVDIIFDAIGNSYTNIKSGKVHALAVATEQKSTDMPELPLVSDTLPTFVTSLWTGIAAPPGTPDDLAKSISADIA
jgi:tripartite-type tricarboxylate transporter receptor subunit TctC